MEVDIDVVKLGLQPGDLVLSGSQGRDFPGVGVKRLLFRELVVQE